MQFSFIGSHPRDTATQLLQTCGTHVHSTSDAGERRQAHFLRWPFPSTACHGYASARGSHSQPRLSLKRRWCTLASNPTSQRIYDGLPGMLFRAVYDSMSVIIYRHIYEITNLIDVRLRPYPNRLRQTCTNTMPTSALQKCISGAYSMHTCARMPDVLEVFSSCVNPIARQHRSFHIQISTMYMTCSPRASACANACCI